jgi:hypothetical protein
MIPNNVGTKYGGKIDDATIYFNTAATASDDPNSPMYNQPYFQEGTPGSAMAAAYNTIYEKITKHELGHTLGLCDLYREFQVPLQTIMNSATENCPNDVCNHQPLEIQSCDNKAISESYFYHVFPPPPPPAYPTPTPTPFYWGGGGTGGGGGFGVYCYDVYEASYYYVGVEGDPNYDEYIDYKFVDRVCEYTFAN